MNAASWIGYLDDVAHLDFMRDVKQRVTDLLELRPSERVLDAGCGTGDDTRAMARLVSPGGRIVGLDSDDTILQEARKRAAGTELPVEFVAGDVQRLDFADETFTRCRSERLFQHVLDVHAAMHELARVTAPGGEVVIYDSDWETLILDADDWQTTRGVVETHCASLRHGRIGRMLPGLMSEASLRDITVEPATLILRDLASTERMHSLERFAQAATNQGRATPEAVAHWFDDLRRRDSEGRFFCAVTSFIVKGRKP